MSEIVKVIGGRIRSYRKKRGWSQEDLAERSDVHFTFIGQIERGEKQASLDTLERITSALEISFEELFRHIGNNTFNDSDALSELIEKVHALSVDDQKQLLKIMELILQWGNKR